MKTLNEENDDYKNHGLTKCLVLSCGGLLWGLLVNRIK